MMADPNNTSIDLSAGLVPKPNQAATQAQPIDLSSGLVPKGKPPQVQTVSDPTPEDYTKMSPADQRAFDTSVRAQRVQNLRDVGSGLAQGVGQTVGTVARVINKIPRIGETLSPSAGIRALDDMTTTKNTAQEVGSGVEGLAEFVLGDEAVKGLSLAERAGLLQKVAKVAESHPAIARVIDAGLNAIRTSTVGTAQSLAHGSSGQEALKTGAVAGGTGAALEGAAAGVKALAPTVEKIAGVDVPVRASQRSKLAATAENVVSGKALQKFDVQQTQPAAKKVIGQIGTDLKNVASERTAAIDADAALQKLRYVSNKASDLRDAASQIKAQSKLVFLKLDDLTKNENFKFSDLQKQERVAYRRGDFDSAQKAKAEQEKIINKFADQFDPRDLQTARENWRQASALEDIHNAINKKSVAGPTPIEFRPKGVPDPGIINGRTFSKEILKLTNDGTLQKAGLTSEHIQSLQDLGTLLENGGAQRRFSRLLTPKNAAAAEAIGLILHPPSAVAAAKIAVPAFAASQALGQIMTNATVASDVVNALKAGAKIGPGISANAYRRAQSEMKRRSLP